MKYGSEFSKCIIYYLIIIIVIICYNCHICYLWNHQKINQTKSEQDKGWLPFTDNVINYIS